MWIFLFIPIFNAFKQLSLTNMCIRNLLQIVIIIVIIAPWFGRRCCLGWVEVCERSVIDSLICPRIQHRRIVCEVAVLLRRHAQTLLERILLPRVPRAVHVIRVGACAGETRVRPVSTVSLNLERRSVRFWLAAEDDVSVRQLPFELVPRLAFHGTHFFRFRVLPLNGLLRWINWHRRRLVRVVEASGEGHGRRFHRSFYRYHILLSWLQNGVDGHRCRNSRRQWRVNPWSFVVHRWRFILIERINSFVRNYWRPVGLVWRLRLTRRHRWGERISFKRRNTWTGWSAASNCVDRAIQWFFAGTAWWLWLCNYCVIDRVNAVLWCDRSSRTGALLLLLFC